MPFTILKTADLTVDEHEEVYDRKLPITDNYNQHNCWRREFQAFTGEGNKVPDDILTPDVARSMMETWYDCSMERRR